jgi:hypothetical protein
LFLDLQTATEDLTRGQAFQHGYYLRHAIRRHRLYKKMNMILVSANFPNLAIYLTPPAPTDCGLASSANVTGSI